MPVTELLSQLGCLPLHLGLLLAQGLDQWRLQHLADRPGAIGSVQQLLDLGPAGPQPPRAWCAQRRAGHSVRDLLRLQGSVLALD